MEDTGRPKIDRRSWFKNAARLAGAGVISNAAGARRTDLPQPRPRGPILASDTNAVVETSFGKVRGYTRNGIFTFKGIPYGGFMGGNTRFLPPSKPEPWTDIRSSMMYGSVCPQEPRQSWKNDEEAWLFSWNDGVPGEDCLRVNVWTPGINDGRKRPVMVWFHGGGFGAGSSQELKSYDGERLSSRGDVVVVGVNHRLGVLGFLNLAEYDRGRYSASANAGLLDLLASLEWVRDNIANFGGNPENVTIFGQSGGGGKVSALMAMPQAKGLFHRAAVQSGSLLPAATPDESAGIAAATLDELGLSRSQLDRLHTIPTEQLILAGSAAVKKLMPPLNPIRIWDQIGWMPTVDGEILPGVPFDPLAPSVSAHVPLLIGTVLNEFLTGIDNPEADSITEQQLRAFVSKFGDADLIIDAYREAYPNAGRFDLLSLIAASPVRRNAVLQAHRKMALGAAPAYLYLFAWKTPVLDGRPRAFHCSDLAFVFDNVDRCENMTGGGPDAHRLAPKVSEAWINFARTGDPNHHGLPKWPAFEAHGGSTMVFNNESTVEPEPERLLALTAPGV